MKCFSVFGVVAAVFGLSVMSARAAEPSADPKPSTPGIDRLTGDKSPLRKDERIAFFGDSVTDQGGYIQLLDAAIKKSPATKDLGVKLLKHGLNGGRVPTVLEGKSPWGDLGAPMQALIEKEKPTVIVIYLGINDVWHGEKGTTKADFEAGLRKMITMSKKASATTILCTPSVIGEETQKNALNDKLGEYSEVTRKLAKDEHLTLCEIHDAFLAELKKVNKENKHAGNLTYDGVHMNEKGNALLANHIAAAIADALKDRSAK